MNFVREIDCVNVIVILAERTSSKCDLVITQIRQIDTIVGLADVATKSDALCLPLFPRQYRDLASVAGRYLDNCKEG